VSLLTAADLAEHFRCTTRDVMEWQRLYDWPKTRIGRKFRWTPEQVAQIERLHAVSPAGVKPRDGRTARSARRSS
jgi:hypothetical protein